MSGDPISKVGTEWRAIIGDVATARTFEDAARRVLAPLVERLDQHVDAAFASDARVLRAIVHVRPGAEYSRVAAYERTGSEGTIAYAPSAITWRWIAELVRPVMIDVRVAIIETLDGRTIRRVDAAAVVSPSAWETQRSWLGRDATHVLGLPLVAVGGGSCGMVTVEVHAPAAIAAPLFPAELVETYGAVVAAVTPRLTDLPLRGDPPEPDALLPVVGASMRDTIRTLRVFARQNETLLLSGPTGAGKSQLARWVHEQSPRARAKFEVVHLATRPEGLRMAELFGWRRGAFTGAVSEYAGALRRAQRGTLFLDEIDKLSLEDQAGLLRVLEEQRYRPLGDGQDELDADVRFVLGTNADLRARVREGTFREDLYYRIHVLPIRVPPLSARRDEVVPWARHMLERRHRVVRADGSATLERAAGVLLEERSWPGNLRQLDNVIRRAHTLAVSEHVEIPTRLSMGVRHIERALAFEGDAEVKPLLDLLHAVANAFVIEAERREVAGGLDLDLADALRGLVLAVAAQKRGSVEAAFNVLGRATTVQHRNHAKAFRKELARLDALYREMSGAPSPYGMLLANGERSGTPNNEEGRE